MKLKIKVEIVYPDDPPTENRPYGTRHVRDLYEQELEVESETMVLARLEAIIKAANCFK